MNVLPQSFLEKKCDPFAKDREGLTILSHAARRADFRSIICILDYIKAEHGEDGLSKLLHKPTKVNKTPLFLSVENGSFKCVTTLFEYGKLDIEKTDYFGNTPLQKAAEGGKLEIVRLLLDGSDLLATDEKNNNALAKAAKGGFIDVVKCLYEAMKEKHGIKEAYRAINEPMEGAPSLLCECARKGHLEVVEVCLKFCFSCVLIFAIKYAVFNWRRWMRIAFGRFAKEYRFSHRLRKRQPRNGGIFV